MADPTTPDPSKMPLAAVLSYVPPTEEESRKFDEQLEAMPTAGYHYVAEPAPGFDVEGLWHTFPCHGRSGYAAHAVALHSALEHLGVPTMLAPHPNMEVDISRFPKDRENMLMRWLKTSVGIPRAFIASMPPDLAGVRVGAPAFASYVAFEAYPMSEYAVRLCNSPGLTALWCVSPFTAHCYVSSGVDPSKVFVVPPPICDGPWKAALEAPRPARPAVSQDAPFTFGALGTWHERKGFHHLLRAYFSSFRRTDPVQLAIRTSYVGDKRPTLTQFEEMVMAEIRQIATEFGDHDWPTSKAMPRVRLLTGTSLTDDDTIRWIGSVDCFVNPSFGEGLGIPPIWAWAQGVPVLSSDFGAVGEVAVALQRLFGPSAGAVFPSTLTPVPKEMLRFSTLFSPESKWGGYSVGALAEAMRNAYGSPPPSGADVAAEVRRRFSFAETRGPLLSALARLVPRSLLETRPLISQDEIALYYGEPAR